MYGDDVELAARVLGELMAVQRVPPCTVTALAGVVARKWSKKTTMVEREISARAAGIRDEMLEKGRRERRP